MRTGPTRAARAAARRMPEPCARPAPMRATPAPSWMRRGRGTSRSRRATTPNGRRPSRTVRARSSCGWGSLTSRLVTTRPATRRSIPFTGHPMKIVSRRPRRSASTHRGPETRRTSGPTSRCIGRSPGSRSRTSRSPTTARGPTSSGVTRRTAISWKEYGGCTPPPPPPTTPCALLDPLLPNGENTFRLMFTPDGHSDPLDVYSYASLCKALATSGLTAFARSGNALQDKREVAAFFAHVADQAGYLGFTDEVNTDPGDQDFPRQGRAAGQRSRELRGVRHVPRRRPQWQPTAPVQGSGRLAVGHLVLDVPNVGERRRRRDEPRRHCAGRLRANRPHHQEGLHRRQRSDRPIREKLQAAQRRSRQRRLPVAPDFNMPPSFSRLFTFRRGLKPLFVAGMFGGSAFLACSSGSSTRGGGSGGPGGPGNITPDAGLGLSNSDSGIGGTGARSCADCACGQGQSCRAGERCASAFCVVDEGTCTGNGSCPGDTVCKDGACVPFDDPCIKPGSIDPGCIGTVVGGADGGVVVIDAGGGVVLPPDGGNSVVRPPMGGCHWDYVGGTFTPLVADLDCDGRPEIIINAEDFFDGTKSQIVALRSDTCTPIWQAKIREQQRPGGRRSGWRRFGGNRGVGNRARPRLSELQPGHGPPHHLGQPGARADTFGVARQGPRLRSWALDCRRRRQAAGGDRPRRAPVALPGRSDSLGAGRLVPSQNEP